MGVAAAADRRPPVRAAGGTAAALLVSGFSCVTWVTALGQPFHMTCCAPTHLCRKEIENMMAIVVNGDACKPDDVEKAFVAIDGVDAVVSTIGGTTADPTADSQASAVAAATTASCPPRPSVAPTLWLLFHL